MTTKKGFQLTIQQEANLARLCAGQVQEAALPMKGTPKTFQKHWRKALVQSSWIVLDGEGLPKEQPGQGGSWLSAWQSLFNGGLADEETKRRLVAGLFASRLLGNATQIEAGVLWGALTPQQREMLLEYLPESWARALDAVAEALAELASESVEISEHKAVSRVLTDASFVL